jgi:N-acetylglucosaminylphosphatidylinositol deacetylase
MDHSTSKVEDRPKVKSQINKIEMRKTSGLSRLLLAISITILAFVVLLQPSTVDLNTALINEHDKKTALILTAHPDDEVMFFTPTILALLDAGWEVGALCLSNGVSSSVTN